MMVAIRWRRTPPQAIRGSPDHARQDVPAQFVGAEGCWMVGPMRMFLMSMADGSKGEMRGANMATTNTESTTNAAEGKPVPLEMVVGLLCGECGGVCHNVNILVIVECKILSPRGREEREGDLKY